MTIRNNSYHILPKSVSENGKHDLKVDRNDLFYPFQQLFDSFYNDFYSDLSPNNLKSKMGYPRWDIYQTDKNWIVEISATGCEPNDIKVEIVPYKIKDTTKRLLKVSGRVSEENQLSDSVQYSVRELRRSAFERCVLLPDDIKGEPEATMKNGVLKLVWDLPKNINVEEKTKRIEIRKLDK